VPYRIRKQGSKWAVVVKATGKVVGTHDTKRDAAAQLRAVYANEKPKKGK
jgi:hypothetical protein